ncbi:hypothetical protein ES702_06460 [subsurface metagenome]
MGIVNQKPIKLTEIPPSGLQPGDRIKLTFKASDYLWMRASQAAVIEWRLDAHPEEFIVWSVDYQQKGYMVFTVQIKQSAKKLWTEKKIADLILGYNPKGFLLVLKNATVEYAKEMIESDVFKYAAMIGIGLLCLVVFMKTQ